MAKHKGNPSILIKVKYSYKLKYHLKLFCVTKCLTCSCFKQIQYPALPELMLCLSLDTLSDGIFHVTT